MAKIISNEEQEALNFKTDPEVLSSQNKPKIKLFKNQIVLNPSISIANFIAFLFFALLSGVMPAPMDVLQLPLLGIRFNLVGGDQDNTNTILLLCDIGTQLITAPIYGYLCNKLGRKVVLAYGLTLLVLDMYLTPLATSVFPELLLIKLMGSNALSSIQVVPLVADYFDYHTRGKMAGVYFVGQGLAGILLTYVYEGADLNTQLPWLYHLNAITIAGFGISILLLAKGGRYHEKLPKETTESADQNDINSSNTQPLVSSPQSNEHSQTIQHIEQNSQPGLFDGIKQAKNPWILIGYMLAFLCTTIYGLVSYINVGYITGFTGQEDSATQAYLLMIINATIFLISSLTFGYLCDRYSKHVICLFAIVSTIIGSGLMIIFPNPYDLGIYFSVGVLGVSGASTSTLSLGLASKCPAPKYKASVLSTNFVFLSLGTIFSAILGVYLLQYNLLLPYYLITGVTMMILALTIFLFIVKKNIM